MKRREQAKILIERSLNDIISICDPEREYIEGYTHGVMEGVEWADQHPNWHKTSDELPQKGGHYLCVANNHMTDLVWKGSCWANLRTLEDIETNKVEYWMERPELPKD